MTIAAWLTGLGLERYVETFVAADVEFDVLAEMSERDFEELGVSLGHRKRMLRALRDGDGPANVAVAAPPAADGERRQVTVLYCDLVGSTALAGRLDQEDLRTVISLYHACCTEIVKTFDGDVAQYLGDGVMVSFGYPRAHEDDAERAVHCALGMVGAVRALVLPHGVRLQTRVGITTGTEVVGDVPGASRDRASVVGATPSLAARLQGMAEPDTVVVGPNTRRLLGNAFALTPLGTHVAKGIDEPIAVWRVDGERRGTSRYAARSSLSSRLVGRSSELALLVERYASVVDGDGRAVLLVAEAGVGKSRIVEELLASPAVVDAVTVRLQCLPHYADSALYPLRAALEDVAGIAQGDAAATRYEKLAAANAHVSHGYDTDALAALLALPDADTLPRVRALTVEQRKTLVIQELLGRLTAAAQARPVILVVEDVHWIDPTTRELLSYVLGGLAGSRVFVLATARPEFVSPWAHVPDLTTLTLNRLGHSAVEELVHELCAEHSLPADVLASIVERSDGVPLFVEELARSVLESAPSDVRTIPATLRDALAARLDALAPVRDIAQIGAVIGREFSRELIAAVSGAPQATLDEALTLLVASGLVLKRVTVAGDVFTFKHALVRDAAYDGMLRPRRQALHLRTARTLRDAFAATADAVPELVARHFDEGGDTAEALAAWQRAADTAIARSAYREAGAHLRRALELSEGADAELPIRNRLGIVFFVLEGGASPNARSVFEGAWTIAATQPENAATFAALWGLCLCNYFSGRLREARGQSAEMIDRAERLGDEDLMLEALHASWGSAFMMGDNRSVFDATKRGAALYRPERHHAHVTKFGTGHDSGVCALGHGAISRVLAGDAEAGRTWLRDTAALIDRLDHPFSRCIGLNHIALASDFLGDYDTVIAASNEAIAIAEASTFPMPLALGTLLRGSAMLAGADPDTGRSVLRTFFGGPTSAPASYQPMYLARLAMAELNAGERDAGEAYLARAEQSARSLDGCLAEAEVHRARAAFLHAQGASKSLVAERLEAAERSACSGGAALLRDRVAADRVRLLG